MVQAFNLILYQPLLRLLLLLYNFVPGNDLGIAIIILTIIIRLILFPFSRISLKSQKALQDLQPKLQEIKKKYAGDQQKQAMETMKLYKENKVNPFSSCLLLLIQLPIMIAVFQVLRAGVADNSLNSLAFGFLNLSRPNIFLAFLTAVLQYCQMKKMVTAKPPKEMAKQKGVKDENIAAIANKQMKLMMPILTLLIGTTLPSGLMIYWLIGLLSTMLEQRFFLKNVKAKVE